MFKRLLGKHELVRSQKSQDILCFLVTTEKRGDDLRPLSTEQEEGRVRKGGLRINAKMCY